MTKIFSNRSSFFTVTVGASLLFHFWRFPHLIVTNGGGAFLLLFFLALFVVGLPLIIAEMALGNRKSMRPHSFLQMYTFLQYLLSHILFLYFLYISSLAAVYFIYFLFAFLGFEDFATSSSFHPSLEYHLGMTGFILLFFHISLQEKIKKTLDKLQRWAIFLCIIIFILVLSRVFSVGNHIEGLRTLFYPDFTLLTTSSMIQAIGHSLLTLLFGVGWVRSMGVHSEKYDLVEIGIQLTFVSAVLSILAGLLALPMVEQVSETLFGSDWLFSILPRWVLYGSHGHYYCMLFFLALFVIAFFLLRTLGSLSIENLKRYPKFYFGHLHSTFFLGNIVIVLLLAFLFYQPNWLAGMEQSPLLRIDQFFVDIFIPLEALLLVAILLSVTTYGERKTIFAKQKVFYHMEYFYLIWRFFSRWVAPALILCGWIFWLM